MKRKKEITVMIIGIFLVLAITVSVLIFVYGTKDKSGSGVYLPSAQELLETDSTVKVQLRIVADLLEFLAEVQKMDAEYKKAVLIKNGRWDKLNEAKFKNKIASYKKVSSGIKARKKEFAQISDYQLAFLIGRWADELERVEKLVLN